jgi:thioesterase domain-containing protein
VTETNDSPRPRSAFRNGEPFRPLVLIQPGTGGVPFFCVHGAAGNVLNFRDIARRLGESQTFYALQAKGIDGSEPLQTVEDMAESYLAEVRVVQPKGPYLLGGYSSGGAVAYEMAQRLVASGEAVALVALLDAIRPGLLPRATSLKEHAERLRAEGLSYVSERVSNKARNKARDLEMKLKVRFYANQGQPLPLELREQRLMGAITAASDRYAPRPYLGRIVLYRATYVVPQFRHAGPKQGWDELTPQLEVVEVPGDHDQLVLEPNVGVMTAHLARLLKSLADQLTTGARPQR